MERPPQCGGPAPLRKSSAPAKCPDLNLTSLDLPRPCARTMSADDAVDAMRVWHAGKGDSGLRFWSDWLPPEEAAEVFAQVESTQLFPWDLRPTLYGERLPQHAFHYLRSDRRASEGSLPGLRALEALCGRVERDLGCGVSDVYCNRFEDPNHRIEWHQVLYELS